MDWNYLFCVKNVFCVFFFKWSRFFSFGLFLVCMLLCIFLLKLVSVDQVEQWKGKESKNMLGSGEKLDQSCCVLWVIQKLNDVYFIDFIIVFVYFEVLKLGK